MKGKILRIIKNIENLLCGLAVDYPTRASNPEFETYLLDFKKDLLFKEIDILHDSIRKYDDMANNLKNWTIVTWGGSIVFVMQSGYLYKYVALTGVLPILFMLTDVHLRKIQRSFIYRFTRITSFVNSEMFNENIKNNDFSELKLLDLRSWLYRGEDFKDFTSFRTIINFKTVSLIYLILCYLSIILSVAVYIFSS